MISTYAPIAITLLVPIYLSYRGASVAAHFAIGLLTLLIWGGVTGVLLSQTSVDRAYHYTYYVVAHFHYLLSISGIFIFFAIIYNWLQRRHRQVPNFWAKLHFWMVFIGINMTIIPQQLFSGQAMPRRYIDYPEAFYYWNMVSNLGSWLVMASYAVFVAVIVYAFTRPAKPPQSPTSKVFE